MRPDMTDQTSTTPLVGDGAPLKAVLFDLDGVLTDTARAHAAAWKQLFDPFLEEHAEETGETFRPFDADEDYLRYVDGKPRHDGIASFLESRGISLPAGSESDPPDAKTIYGLGHHKNRFYQQWLREHRVPAFPAAVRLVGQLRQSGVRVAVFSASRNARAVLESAGIADRFDVIVDGNDLADLGYAGKPDPAMLLTAAERLGVAPSDAAVIEDAIAGVTAGVAGGFRRVIGVDRGRNGRALAQAGAKAVVQSLAELVLANGDLTIKTLSAVPPFRDHKADVRGLLSEKALAVFLDYDGTLSPIVEDHTKAFLSDDMRAAVDALGRVCLVAVVSGRDLKHLRSLVQLDDVTYAGSHGFEIVQSGNSAEAVEKGTEFLPVLDSAEQNLRDRLAAIPGHSVERKRFSIAVHFRLASDPDAEKIEVIVDNVLSEYPTLRKGFGKKVFELRPDIEWDKGRAVLWLLQELKHGDAVLPIYVGDDITDEDAFRALAGRGLGVVVVDAGDDRPTAADFALSGTEEVRHFLEFLKGVAVSAGQSPP